MSERFDTEVIAPLRQRLDQHPIYAAVRTLDDLRVFMAHHVYSVWDFMSLIKYLQHTVAPARWPWTPGADPTVQRFINELNLEEETDAAAPGQPGEFASHFQLYLGAMREIGADADTPVRFVELVRTQGLDAALGSGLLPEPALTFTRVTFGFIASGKPHIVAAALALGREHVIPNMFRAFLARMAVSERERPPSIITSSDISTSTRTSTHRSPSACWRGCARVTRRASARPRPPPSLPSRRASASGTACLPPCPVRRPNNPRPRNMPQLIVLPHEEYCPEGAVLEAQKGVSICDTLLDNGIEIEHACEKSCACTTCHVILREGYESLSEPTEAEEDLLDKAWGLEPTSRLSCQALIGDEDLVVEIPKYSINMVKEGH